MGLWHNCTKDEDFYAQASALRERLLSRGYTQTNLRKAYNKALAHIRSSLLYGFTCKKQLKTVKIITTFSAHHNQLKNFLSDHWHLLTNHRILKKYIRPTPELVFHRATSLKDKLTSSHYQEGPCSPRDPHSIFRCGQCARCPWIQEGTKFILPNRELFTPAFHANCSTKGVIYLIVCACNAFYVGKTIRELRQRIGDHLYCSTNGKFTTVGRHIGLHHRFNPEVVKLVVLETIPKDVHGGDWDRKILQREAVWIEFLNANIPPGLNEGHTYKTFL